MDHSTLQTPQLFTSKKVQNLTPTQNQSPNHQNQKEEKPVHRTCLFWISMLPSFFLGGMNIIIFFSNDATLFFVSMPLFTVGSIIVSLINSCIIAPTKKAAFCLYFLLDNLVLLTLAAEVGFVGMLSIIIPNIDAITIVIIIVMGCTWFVYVGNYRLIFAFTKWVKWQVIVGKVCLILASLIFLGIATFFMRFDFDFGTGVSSDKVKDFFFLYIFGLMSLLLEIYGKISDLDGTANLSYRYSFDEEAQELKSVITEEKAEEETKTPIRVKVKVEQL